MELNTVGVVALLGGLVLLYAAVKNKYPQDVIREALGKPPLRGSLSVGGVINGTGKELKPTGQLTPPTGIPVVTV